MDQQTTSRLEQVIVSEPSNELIYQTLLEQNKMLGRIEANTTTLDRQLTIHVGKYEGSVKRIEKLEAAHNKLRGAAMVWSLIVSAVVSAAGWYFGNGPSK